MIAHYKSNGNVTFGLKFDNQWQGIVMHILKYENKCIKHFYEIKSRKEMQNKATEMNLKLAKINEF